MTLTLLTSRQEQVLDYIRRYLQEYGYSPTLHDIGVGTGISSSSAVHYHLRKLRCQGLISYEPGRARTIRIKELT